MIDKVCQILKGIAIIGWLCTAQTETSAATYYATPKGTSSGACATVGTACNFGTALSKLSLAGGDTLNMLGGTYDDTDLNISTLMGVNGKAFATETVIQANGWTAEGALTEAQVFVDSVRTSGVTWTNCATNCSTTCPGVPTAACSATWKTSNASYQSIRARTPDGTPTYQVSAITDLSGSFPTYKSGRCSPRQAWRPCSTTADCQGTDTCTGNQQIYLSYAQNQGALGNTLYVKWGGSVPSGVGVVIAQIGGQGGGFWVLNSSNVTVKGLIIRNTTVAGMVAQNSSNIKFIDNHIYFSSYMTPVGQGSGSDYGMQLVGGSGNGVVEASSNDIAYSGSELIHAHGRDANAATAFNISKNYLHHCGDSTVLGPDGVDDTGARTPQGMIISDDYSGNGNYTGTVIDGNIIDFSATNHADLTGIRLEDKVTAAQISNNIIYSPTGACLFFATEFVGISSNNVFNNLFYKCGRSASQIYERTGIVFGHSGGGGVDTNNNVFNNTVLVEAGPALFTESGSLTATGNIFRNNIFQTTNGGLAVDWSSNTSTTNKFDHNLVYSVGANPVMNWQPVGSFFTCSGVLTADTDNNGTGDANQCADPLFNNVNTKDFHLTANSSSAIDKGTATGMPASRSVSIYNTTASAHGFPSYADGNDIQNGTWDIGVDEYLPPVTNLLLDCQDPGFEQCAFVGGGTSTETSPCDEPIGGEFNGGETTIVNDPALAHSGNCFAKMRQFTFLDTCTPPALPGLKWDVSGLIVGNQYQVNGFVNFPTTIATQIGSFYLLMCTDVTDLCTPENPLGLAGLPQIGVCSGGTRNGLPCDEPTINVVGQCPGGGTCNPVPGYQPFSFVFQATATTQTLRFLALSSERQIDAAHPRYLYIDDISVIPRP